MDVPLKRCKRCGEFFPATSEYFYPSRNTFNPRCKPCECARRKDYYAENRDAVLQSVKKYAATNRDAVKQRNKAWRERNAEKVADKNRSYHQQHKDRLNEYCRNYRKANKDALNAQSRAYYRATQPLRLIQAKEYRETHKDERAAYHKTYYHENSWRFLAVNRLRLQAKRASDTISADDLVAQRERQQGLCYWCSIPLDSTYQIDHVIPLSRGGEHTTANIVLACRKCNQSKWAKLPYTEWQPPNPLRSQIDKE